MIDYMNILGDVLINYNYEIRPYSHGLLFRKKNKKIEIKESLTESLFSNLFERLKNKLGTPDYVHSFYGFVWKKEGVCVAYNIIEENYNCEALEILLSDTMPFGKKLSYEEYVKTDGIIRDLFMKYGFSVDAFVHYTDIGFSYAVSNENAQSILFLNKNALRFYQNELIPLENGMKKVVPRRSEKKAIKIKNSDMLRQNVQTCLENSFQNGNFPLK